MKKALLILLTALTAIGMIGEAGAAESDLMGYFATVNQAAMLGYENEEKCGDDGGTWFENECFFGAEDSVSVKAVDGGLRVSIETFGLTGAMCEYQGTATFRDSNTLISSRPVQEWNGSEFVAATCEVEVVSLIDGAVSVRNNGKCDTFCGARAALEIAAAKRQ